MPSSKHHCLAFANVAHGVCCCCCACPTLVSVLQLPVRALCFSPDASHAISAAVGERLVAVWVAPQQGGKKKSGGVAAASLAVAQPVVQLATTGGGPGEVSGQRQAVYVSC
jgi:hypothetical protein